ncbi:11545_t:CDS:2 [Diversispora eburnea]|uniref:11545_t:CDS:1 n=1 Tax=Diversispora eburnea TaxID=1213867 RepID=A0A9N9G235_9GLOM|nr:11545_t:CDS:2 [Diversispora eburnea]
MAAESASSHQSSESKQDGRSGQDSDKNDIMIKKEEIANVSTTLSNHKHEEGNLTVTMTSSKPFLEEE